MKHRLLFPLLILLAAVPALLQAQDTMPITREDQLRFFTPTVSGQTGLFETVSADTLHRGEWAFGVYYNDYDLLAGPANGLAPPSARDPEDLSYDLYQLSASIGVGLTDRWEITAMLPWDRIGRSVSRLSRSIAVTASSEMTVEFDHPSGALSVLENTIFGRAVRLS